MAVAVVDIRVDSSAAVSNLRRLDQASKNSQNALDALARKAAGLGAALVGGFAVDRIIRDVTELDRNIRRLGTVGVDVAKISPALSRLSDELGGVANKADLAAASYQAASAGFSDTAGNVEILRAATKAATGGLAETAAVTEVLVKTLNAYGMSGSQAFKVTDSISKAVELGNQEWSDYTLLLGRVASISALAGLSIDELNAFIASATKNGATAEVAFTGLGATLNTLLQPTKESQEAAAKLGIAWNYGGLQAKGFTGLMAELAKAMEKDKETTARLLGTQEAMRGAFAANAKGGNDFRMVLEQLSSAAGKTQSDFDTMKGSLENTLKALDTSFRNLSEALGRAFGPTVVIAVQDITKAVNGFADFMAMVPQPIMNTAGELVKLIIQLLLVEKAIKAIIGLSAAFVAAQVAIAGATASTGAAATTSASAFALYTNNAKTLQATSAAATGSVSGLSAALLRLASIGIITVGVNYVITQIGEISGSIKNINTSEAAGTAKSLAEQLKGKSAAERKQMLAAAQKNLTNDKRLAQRLQLQMQAQETASIDKPDPSQRTKLLEVQARIKTNQARIKAIQSAPAAAVAATPNAMGTSAGAAVGGGDGKEKKKKGKTDAERAAEEAKKEAERVAEVVRNRLAEGQMIRMKSDMQDKIAAAEAAGDKMLVARLQGQQKEVDLQYQYAKQLAEEKDMRAQQSIIFEAQSALVANQRDVQRELNELQNESAKNQIAALEHIIRIEQQLTDQQKQQKELTDSIAGTVGQGMTSAFDVLIKGSQDWGSSLREIASGVLIDIARQLLQVFVIQKAISAIGGFLQGPSTGAGVPSYAGVKFNPLTVGNLPSFRANGGSVMAGKPYVVGERGPELFMPGRSGGIAPSGSFGGGINVVVNVDAGGTSVQGDQQQGVALGRAVSAAVKAELIKQKRPGGILA